ncbi:SagB/ThcOx family dehydrogenase [Variovorax sp. MHTC-1]|uniref:SagB/ThcOx family dehydrogenase n=1 Tax=Variovorax sp. MHTC-1 TaxID=2495593 RepID=UPI000F894966|nr:SagB/ThcOx family dehydrogenase [Variovorax sp. MHTC-1]
MQPIRSRQSADVVALPKCTSSSFGELAARRRSARKFSANALSIELLSNLLQETLGVTGRLGKSEEGVPGYPLFPYPSAGALGALDVYLIVRHVAALAPGIYRFLPDTCCLERVSELNTSVAAKALLDDSTVDRSATTLVFVAVLRRLTHKYGIRSYRLAHLEAGHAAQNVVLHCTATGLSSFTSCAFHDRDMSALLCVDGLTEIPCYVVHFGNAA